MRRYFVTGTDTGVGKTYVTAALARRARVLGQKVFAFKPIETGCEVVDGRRVGADQELLCEAAGGWQTGEQRGIYRLLQPAAPWVAAQAESVGISLERVLSVANSVADVDVTLVEGAGGWRVPITAAEDMSDLARRLDAPVIVVARATLGTINHSLLTLEAVERDGLRVAALVLSQHPNDDRALAESNAAQIRHRWPGPVVLFGSELESLDPLLR